MQNVEIKLIDRKVANAQRHNNILIQSLKENAKNKNTQQSTNNWLKVWKSWASQKGYDESIEKYEPEALNKILEEFYATVRKKDGEDYEPDSVRVNVTAIDRYLTQKEYKHSIIRDREFKSSKQVLEEKARLLRQQGKGKRTNKARSLTTTEENELWEKKKLGKGSPQVLVKQFGGFWPNILVFEVDRNTTAWRLKISPLDWVKTSQSTSSLSRTSKKHASPDCPQSPEASFQKCLQLEMTDVPLQSSKSFCGVVLPKYGQPVHFICLYLSCQIRPRKFHTISQVKIINSRLARGNSFISSTSISSNIFNPFSPDPQLA